MAEKGFLVSLFDLSFTEFVTTRLIKVLFVLAIIGSAIGGITLVATGLLSDSGAVGIIGHCPLNWARKPVTTNRGFPSGGLRAAVPRWVPSSSASERRSPDQCRYCAGASHQVMVLNAGGVDVQGGTILQS